MKFNGITEKQIIEVEKILNRYIISYIADRDYEAITAFISIEENSNIDPDMVSIFTLEIPDSEIKTMHPHAKRHLFKNNIIVDKEFFKDANLSIHTPDPKPSVENYVIWTMGIIITFCMLGILISI